MRHLLPAAVNWSLAGYALVLCAGVWIFAFEYTRADYRSTLHVERDHLRSVSATLQAQVEAMLGDGVGAALAAANELEIRSRISPVGDSDVAVTLRQMLTGGPYVRSLFLVNSKSYVRVGRVAAAGNGTEPPAWLRPALDLGTGDAWVGGPIPDPDNPGERVIPIARRVGHGGRQAGWAGALIDFNHLEGAYQQPESGSGVALFTAEGTVLTLLYPDVKLRAAEGSNIGGSELFRRAIAGPASAVIDGPSPFANRMTIAAYDRVSGYPMLVAASRRREDALGSWYGRRRDTAVLSLGITLLVTVTTGVLHHFLGVLRRRELHYDAERERVLNEMHELAATLVHVQDDERRRIGRDLHDSTGQGLAALELSLTRLARTVDPNSSSAGPLVEECVNLARQCSTEIRTASYLLHPPLLDEIGLLSALRWLADGLRQRSTMTIALELPESMDRLPPELELAFFRVAQEALTNVHRHSGSASVRIRLCEQDGSIVLEVDDAGCGIAERRSSGQVTDAFALGVGLAGMRERMRQLGGTLRVRTGGQGTCVQASLALSSMRLDCAETFAC